MNLDFSMLARAVHVSDGEFFIHGGGLRRIGVPSLPAVIQIAFAATWVAELSEIGDEHTLGLRIYAPGVDEPIVSAPPTAVVLNPVLTEGEEEDDEAKVSLVVGSNLSIGLSVPGRYRVTLILDDEVAKEMPLVVGLVARPPEGASDEDPSEKPS